MCFVCYHIIIMCLSYHILTLPVSDRYYTHLFVSTTYLPRVYQVQYVSCLLPHNTTFFRRCYTFTMYISLVCTVMCLISYHILTLPVSDCYYTHLFVSTTYLPCVYQVQYVSCLLPHNTTFFCRCYTFTMYISLVCTVMCLISYHIRIL